MLAKQLCSDPDIYVIAIDFPNGFLSGTNSYIIHDHDEWLIIDTGFPIHVVQESYERGLRELHIDWEHASVFVTHTHRDHVGLIDAVVPDGTRIYLGSRGYECYAGPRADESFAEVKTRFEVGGAAEDEVTAFAKTMTEIPGFDAARFDIVGVNEGDTVQVGETALQVLCLSGHSLGQVGLYEPKSATLFCGDQILHGISPSMDPMLFGIDSVAECEQNLRKVKQLQPKHLAWGHGEMRDDFPTRIDELLTHYAERTQEVLEIVERTPGLVAADAVKQVGWNVPFDTWEEISVFQRGVILGTGFALLDHLVAEGRLVVRDDRYYPAGA